MPLPAYPPRCLVLRHAPCIIETDLTKNWEGSEAPTAGGSPTAAAPATGRSDNPLPLVFLPPRPHQRLLPPPPASPAGGLFFSAATRVLSPRRVSQGGPGRPRQRPKDRTPKGGPQDDSAGGLRRQLPPKDEA